MQGQSPALKVRFNSGRSVRSVARYPTPLDSLRGLKIRKRTSDAFDVGNVFEQLGNRVPFPAHEGLSRVVG